MRIVATSDTHFPFDPNKIPDGDVFVHAGDLMYTGYVDEWYPRLECLRALPHKIKIFVPGNHDIHVQAYPGPAIQELMRAGVTVLGVGPRFQYHHHKLPNGMTVLGLPFVKDLPTWAFNSDEEKMDTHMEECGRFDIVVSHSPPAALLDGHHYGFQAYRRYIKRFQPDIWICGHVHESYGFMKEGKTDVYNVCMCDENYEQTNPAVIIDV